MSASPETEWRQERIRLTLPNDLAHIVIARATVRAAARAYGYSERELDNWETVIEEAVSNVVRRAYAPGEKASFDVDCLQGSEGLTVRIRDRGRPFDPRRIQPMAFGGDPATMPQHGLGWHLMHRLMDVVTLESLGREGKQLTLFKAAPHQIDTSRLSRPVPPRPAPEGDAVVRRATNEDADEIMRLFYDCYRYSYFNEQVYSAEALARMLGKGELESFVAELPDGTLVGHSAVIHYPDRPEAVEIGMAATDPSYRGRGVFDQMIAISRQAAAQSSKRVLFGGAVTVHVASQKVAVKQGVTECGLMLGAVPSETFTGLETGSPSRGTIMMMAGLLQPRPAPRLVLPAGDEAFITGLYEQCNIPFALGEARPPDDEHTDVTISVRPMLGTVRAVVQRIGGDLTERIRGIMHGARQTRTEVGQLFLPLTDPALPKAVEALKPLGWFPTGILPEGGPAGDMLLMHWLNGWAIDYDSIAIAREQGQRLLQEVRARDPEWQ